MCIRDSLYAKYDEQEANAEAEVKKAIDAAAAEAESGDLMSLIHI